MEREKAFELLKKYDEENFHIQYALTVEEVMKWYANKLGYDADYWGIIGLLHDLGYEVVSSGALYKNRRNIKDGRLWRGCNSRYLLTCIT